MPTKAPADSAQQQRKSGVIDDITNRSQDRGRLGAHRIPRALPSTDLAELRAALRPAQTDYKVYKNTLARRVRERRRLHRDGRPARGTVASRPCTAARLASPRRRPRELRCAMGPSPPAPAARASFTARRPPRPPPPALARAPPPSTAPRRSPTPLLCTAPRAPDVTPPASLLAVTSNAVDLRSRIPATGRGNGRRSAPAGRGEAWLAASRPPVPRSASVCTRPTRRGSPCPPRLPPTARNSSASRPSSTTSPIGSARRTRRCSPSTAGSTVTDLANLRAALRPASTDYKVYKNTLARRPPPTSAHRDGRVARGPGGDRVRAGRRRRGDRGQGAARLRQGQPEPRREGRDARAADADRRRRRSARRRAAPRRAPRPPGRWVPGAAGEGGRPVPGVHPQLRLRPQGLHRHRPEEADAAESRASPTPEPEASAAAEPEAPAEAESPAAEPEAPADAESQETEPSQTENEATTGEAN